MFIFNDWLFVLLYSELGRFFARGCKFAGNICVCNFTYATKMVGRSWGGGGKLGERGAGGEGGG